MTRYATMFDRLEREQAGAFVPFCVLGDPTVESSIAIVETLAEAGADALELGIAFSDPVADGPTIQAADLRALGAGARPADAWRIVAAVRRAWPTLPIGLLVYANLVEARGREDFYQKAAAAGVDSVLIADVPTVEAEPYLAAAERHGIDPVLIATPNANAEALAAIARMSRGYTYVVSRVGVTGEADEAGGGHEQLLEQLAELGAPPALLGFGISSPEHVRAALKAGARGAICGSAIVQLIERFATDSVARAQALSDFVHKMKAATRPRAEQER